MPPEIDLLLACLRGRPNPPPALDWPLFFRLAQYHSVVPLVYTALGVGCLTVSGDNCGVQYSGGGPCVSAGNGR